MSNAVLGLRAAGRGAEVISSNISNALTPGYARRELVLTSGTFGGVKDAGVQRVVDPGITSDRRLSAAANSNAQSRLDFLSRVEDLLGTPDRPGSLSAHLGEFERSLVAAISRPDAPDRLETAVTQANGLARAVRTASQGIQDARSLADRTISAQVSSLNSALKNVELLNKDIQSTQARGGDTNALKDQRQSIVDPISDLVPLRVLNRDGGKIAIYSTSGTALLDGRAREIGFAPVNVVTADMTIDAGLLSGLTIDGNPIRTGSSNGALRGGAIAAQFSIRDDSGASAQTTLDAYARNLIERFADPSVDPTLSPGDPGLFSDGGNAFDPLDETGLAGRITLNAAVDSQQGGEAWRLRDGIYASAQGPVGQSSILQNLSAALAEPQATTSGIFAGSSFTASGFISSIISNLGVDIISAEQEVSFTSSRLSTLTQEQLANGVDSDQEIQRLILVEQSYAANARMLGVLDEMMQILNRL